MGKAALRINQYCLVADGEHGQVGGAVGVTDSGVGDADSSQSHQFIGSLVVAGGRDGWHEGKSDDTVFIKYLLGTILAAYKDFGDRFAIVEEKLPAVDMVRKATLNKIGRFTKQDIRELCPSLSISSVEGALRKMVAAGELKREGNGKSTCYYRLK